MLTLIIPLGAFRDLVVLEFLHSSVVDLALDDTETPRINDARDFAIPRDVLAIVPGVKLFFVFWLNEVSVHQQNALSFACHAGSSLGCNPL